MLVPVLIVGIACIAFFLLRSFLARQDALKYADKRRVYLVEGISAVLQNVGQEMGFASSFECLEQGTGYSHYKWDLSRESGQFGFVSLEIEALAKVRNFEVRPEDPGFEKEMASIRDKIKTMVQI